MVVLCFVCVVGDGSWKWWNFESYCRSSCKIRSVQLSRTVTASQRVTREKQHALDLVKTALVA